MGMSGLGLRLCAWTLFARIREESEEPYTTLLNNAPALVDHGPF